VSAAAALIHERGVVGTTLDDVRAAADVSGSQLSHYFAGKDELLQAVIDHQASVIVGNRSRPTSAPSMACGPGGTWSSPPPGAPAAGAAVSLVGKTLVIHPERTGLTRRG
jgi:hypothetical protein